MPPPTAPYRYEAQAWRRASLASPASTRRAAGPWPGRWWRRPSSSRPTRRIAGWPTASSCSPERRELLYALIQERAVAVGVGIVDHLTIDRINILEATRLAMAQALDRAGAGARAGHHRLRRAPRARLPAAQPGRRRCALGHVAAASIIAKVTRDRHHAGDRSGVSPSTASPATRATRRPSTSPRSIATGCARCIAGRSSASGARDRSCSEVGAPIWPRHPASVGVDPGRASL